MSQLKLCRCAIADAELLVIAGDGTRRIARRGCVEVNRHLDVEAACSAATGNRKLVELPAKLARRQGVAKISDHAEAAAPLDSPLRPAVRCDDLYVEAWAKR